MTSGNYLIMRGAVMRNGVIAFAGNGLAYSDPVVAVLDASGHAPAGYGQDGVLNVSLGADLSGSAEAVQLTADGRALALIKVYSSESFGARTATAMIMPNGIQDVSYGANGVVVHPALAKVEPSTFVLLPFGKALIGGVDATEGGNGVVVDRTARSQIDDPARSRISSKKLKKFSGTAGPVGLVARVEIALQRLDKSLLKKEKRCFWLRNNMARFAKVLASKKSCSTPKWLKVTGTESWRYELKRKLPRATTFYEFAPL